jgi:hypothetical protein
LAVIFAGLGGLPCTMAARANIFFNFSGTCSNICSGTATGVLTLTDAYVFGSDITAADFVSFSYKSSDQNFSITGPNVSYLAGGLNADGSLSSNVLVIDAGPLSFGAVSGTDFGANNSDAGISFAFTPLLPPNFISPEVPHDVPTGPSASIQDLAIFAWREFIALNWVAMDPATTGVRGRPNVNLGVNAGFLSIKPDQNGSFPLLVWHTYRHKNELFPYYHTAQTDSVFDSSMPTYNYQYPPKLAVASANFHIFNNLDETSEIGLCQMFAHNTTRIAYEAKVSRAIFDYANRNNLTKHDVNGNYPALTEAQQKTIKNLAQYGGMCSTDSSIVSLPCGDAAVAGDDGEGAIEIKAAWRQLNPTEAASGRFFTQTILFYKGEQGSQSEPGNQTYNNAVYGLVALHIIHKTKSFPAFVFASWEQIDDYDDAANQNTEALQFNNLGYPGSSIYPNNPPPPNISVMRNHPLHSRIPTVNDAVHEAFTKIDPNTVWQYYKLIGVQATPVSGPPSQTATPDDVSYYYLANIVVETNQTLQNFAGSLPLITATPFLNVYLNGASGSPFQMGGCQGCHGAAGQSNGGDMSVLIGFGPSNAAGPPESIDNSAEAAVKSYAVRSYGLIRARSLGLIPQ